MNKTTNGATTNYLINDSGIYYSVIAEYNEDKKATASYTFGNETISIDNGGEVSYYVVDGQANVRALTDENGKITDTYSFDAFGNVTKKTGNTYNPYLYNQEQFDGTTGLYYLRARYMNPQNGRFMSMDEYGGSISDPYSCEPQKSNADTTKGSGFCKAKVLFT